MGCRGRGRACHPQTHLRRKSRSSTCWSAEWQGRHTASLASASHDLREKLRACARGALAADSRVILKVSSIQRLFSTAEVDLNSRGWSEIPFHSPMEARRLLHLFAAPTGRWRSGLFHTPHLHILHLQLPILRSALALILTAPECEQPSRQDAKAADRHNSHNGPCVIQQVEWTRNPRARRATRAGSILACDQQAWQWRVTEAPIPREKQRARSSTEGQRRCSCAPTPHHASTHRSVQEIPHRCHLRRMSVPPR